MHNVPDCYRPPLGENIGPAEKNDSATPWQRIVAALNYGILLGIPRLYAGETGTTYRYAFSPKNWRVA